MTAVPVAERGALVVTGASGRIGRHVVPALDADGWTVVGWDSSVDVRDRDAVASAMRGIGPRVVVHLAGRTRGSDPELIAANVAGTRNVVDAAIGAGASRIVFASSAAVYGDRRPHPVSERTDDPSPDGAYGRAKLAAEALLAVAEVETVALRIFNVWGPGFDESLVDRLSRATEAEPVELRGPDVFVRDYIHVDDVVRAIALAANTPLSTRHVILNIGTGEATSSSELVERVARHSTPFVVEVAGPSSVSVADATLAFDLLGWRSTRRP